MTLHPEMAAILAEAAVAAVPAPDTVPLDVARANFTAANAAWNMPVAHVGGRNVTVGGVGCRLLRPADPRPGTVVFVHGGGWTFGTPATHERFASLLAAGTRRPVLVPDYRLAPEHAAPAAVDDVLAVLAEWDAPGPLVLAGDSAGANIALAAALARPPRTPAFLSLLYGCFAPDFDTASHARNGEGYGLTTARMRWYWRNWLGAAPDPRAAPGHADDLAGLPPCHLLAAGLDPLLDDSIRLAARLAVAGVSVRLDVVPGVVHGFLQMTSRLTPAVTATRDIVAAINNALEGTPEGNSP